MKHNNQRKVSLENVTISEHGTAAEKFKMNFCACLAASLATANKDLSVMGLSKLR